MNLFNEDSIWFHEDGETFHPKVAEALNQLTKDDLPIPYPKFVRYLCDKLAPYSPIINALDANDGRNLIPEIDNDYTVFIDFSNPIKAFPNTFNFPYKENPIHIICYVYHSQGHMEMEKKEMFENTEVKGIHVDEKFLPIFSVYREMKIKDIISQYEGNDKFYGVYLGNHNNRKVTEDMYDWDVHIGKITFNMDKHGYFHVVCEADKPEE